MKKLLLSLFALSLLLPGIGQAVEVDYLPETLLKAPGHDTIYYVGYDGKRYVFPNADVYFSWYEDFNSVKVVSAESMRHLPLAGNVLMRPGTHLIKLASVPTVYGVGVRGDLLPLASEAEAARLYGEDWARRVVDFPEPFFMDYTIVDRSAEAEVPNGTILHYQGDPLTTRYIVTNGKVKQLNNHPDFGKYRVNPWFVVDLPFQNAKYEKLDAIEAYTPVIGDTAQTLVLDRQYTYLEGDSKTGAKAGRGLLGKYYTGSNFNYKVAEQVDEEIDFNWEEGKAHAWLSNDDFSIRWEGYIHISTPGTYSFETYSDDGVRLYVDNELIIDEWDDHDGQWDEATIRLKTGYVPIRLEYYDSVYDAEIRLTWEGQRTIPSDKLFVEKP